MSLSPALPARAPGLPLEAAPDWAPGLPMVIGAFALEGATVLAGGSVVVGYWA